MIRVTYVAGLTIKYKSTTYDFINFFLVTIILIVTMGWIVSRSNFLLIPNLESQFQHCNVDCTDNENDSSHKQD